VGRGRDPVDTVAMILALALGLVAVLILVATMVQILNSAFPQVELSDNASQVLTTAVGALAGLIGSYIGGRHRRD
jgi:hypothetical protein